MAFQPTRRFLFASPWHFIALGLGSGLAPKAPGTVGTLAALPFAIGLSQLPLWLSGCLIAATVALGTYACSRTARAMNEHDHGSIVIDEFAGLFITLWLLPAEPLWWLAGFTVFRLLDIAKPWPIRWFDSNVHGGWCIMVDDLIAGALSAAILILAGALL